MHSNTCTQSPIAGADFAAHNHHMSADRPMIGIALMLGFCVLAPIGDATAKYLGQSLPVAQLLTVRFGAQVVFLLPIALWLGIPLRTNRRVFWRTVLRTLLHMVGIFAMFSSLKYLPLADAVAIAFLMPFFMLLLGRFVLNETVGPRRLWACLAGFIGTLLVIQPSFAAVGWPALLPLLVAVVFSLFMLVTRTIAKETDPIGLQVTSGILATLILIPLHVLLPLAGVTAFDLVAPTSTSVWIWLVMLGVVGSVAHLAMTWSLRFAPTSTLAPMQYLEIPVAAVIGWLVFQEFPNGLALFGIGITIAAGLYIVWREHAAPTPTPSTPPPPRPAPPAAE